MKYSKYIFFFLCVACLNAFSQGGSNYSIFGIGDLIYSNGATASGMAGTSIAVPSEYSINFRNPALWSKVTTTRLQVGYLFNQHVIEDNDNTLWQNNGKVNQVSSVFSVDTANGVSFNFSLYPYSSKNYLIDYKKTQSFYGEDLNSMVSYQGSGGISIAQLGAASNIFKNLSVGVAAFLSFGNLTYSTTTIVYGDNTNQSISTKQDNIQSWGWKIGAIYSPFDNLTIGAFINNFQKFDFDREITFESNLITDTSYTVNCSFQIPKEIGFGISYLSEKFLFAADYSLQDFSNFSYQSGPKTEFKQSSNYTFAVSRLGNIKAGASFTDKITYNFGIGYRELYYKIAGQNINEFLFSFGIDTPIIGTTMLHSSITLGKRGTQESGLINEYFGRINVDLSIGEVWFKPIKREY